MNGIQTTGINPLKTKLNNLKKPKSLRKPANFIRKVIKLRLRTQTDLEGNAWKPRSRKSRPTVRRKKMLRGLNRVLRVLRVTDKNAVIGFARPIERFVAMRQQYGVAEKKLPARSFAGLTEVEITELIEIIATEKITDSFAK